MVASNYSTALKKVLVHEGGFADHPADPGGATMRGVTQRVYDAERDRRGLSRQSVKRITDAELEAIYRRQYADVVRFDALPAGLDYVVFDGAVNSGPRQSIKWLQRALGALYKGPIDGVMGGLTLAAVERADVVGVISRILDRRMAFLRALRTWKVFGRGWTARIDNVRRDAVRMVNSQPGTVEQRDAIAILPGMDVKAVIEDAIKLPAPIAVPTIGAGSTVAVALEAARQQIEPFAGIGFVSNVLAGLALAGAAVAIGGAVYGFIAKRRKARLVDALDPDVVPA